MPTPASGSNYSLSVMLTDSNGSGTGTITFTGDLQGQLTHDSSNLTNTITGVTDGTGTHAGQTFGIVTFDGTQYTVSYNGFAAPGPEAAHNVGSLSFHIAYRGGHWRRRRAARRSRRAWCWAASACWFVGGVVFRARRRQAGLLKAAI